jgi:hypothetical protein
MTDYFMTLLSPVWRPDSIPGGISTTMSKTALSPTQPPIQCLLVSESAKCENPTTLLHVVACLRMGEASLPRLLYALLYLFIFMIYFGRATVPAVTCWLLFLAGAGFNPGLLQVIFVMDELVLE